MLDGPSRFKMSFRHSLKRGFATLRISTNAKVPTQTFQHTTTSPFPTIPQCPPATCSCRPMPQDLDISPRPFDRTVAPYSEHILIHTGRSDWPSKIEDDNRNTIPHELKRLFKPGSQYHDVRGFFLSFQFVLFWESSIIKTDFLRV